MLLRVFIIFFLLVSRYAFAFSECESETEQCVAIGEWNISLGLGGGLYTNPLHDSSNTPLFLIPRLSYYGENIFFQNNTLGYSLFEGDTLVISAITLINTEQAHFDRWHPTNIFIPNTSQDFIAAHPSEKVNPKDVKKRQWAADAGAQVNWFVNDTLSVELQLVHDITGVYNGLNGSVELNKWFTLNSNSGLDITVGAQWNSSALVDYYYGIDFKDSSHPKDYFEGKSSLNPYAHIGYTYKISQEWKFQAFAKRKFIDSNTFNSPLVKDKNIDLIFIGFFYEF